MATLEVKLKQHTPLIHFQWEQEDATLRASEVKPKLDKFIIRKLGGIDKIRQQHRDWLIGNGSHEALNYKMRLKNTKVGQDENLSIFRNKKNKYETTSFPMMLINMGGKDKKDDVYNFVYYEEIKLIIFCLNKTLQETIIEYLPIFLATTNFGNRQSKGFGSFYIHEKDKIYKKPEILMRNFPELKNRFVITKENVKQFQSFHKEAYYGLFRIIELFYKSLRGGINECKLKCYNQDRDCKFAKPFMKNDKYIYLCSADNKYRYQNNCKGWNESVFYLKSLMFKYAKSLGFQWEKKTIKNVYNDLLSSSQRKKYLNSDISLFQQNSELRDYYLFKDLLGLSTKEKWGVDKISLEENKIERFKSPLIIKPIRTENNEYTIYLVCKDIPITYLGKCFNVSFSNQNRLNCQIYPQFSLKGYFDFLFGKNNDKYNIDIQDLVGFKECCENDIYKILVNIFEQIRERYDE